MRPHKTRSQQWGCKACNSTNMASVSNLLACANPYESVGKAGLLAPFRFLIAPMNWPNYGQVLLFGWAILALLFVVIYLVLPSGWYNSSNMFKSAGRSAITSVIIFFGLTFSYVVIFRESECQQLAMVKKRALKGAAQSLDGVGPAVFSDVEASDFVRAGTAGIVARDLTGGFFNIFGGKTKPWKSLGHYQPT